WLNRADLVRVGFSAVRELMEAKAEAGFLPASSVQRYNAKIDDALAFIPVVHEADCIANPIERARQLELLGDDIVRRNREILVAGVRNQAFPINREIGGRWFDELGWPGEMLDAVAPPEPTPLNGAPAKPGPGLAAATTRGTLPAA